MRASDMAEVQKARAKLDKEVSLWARFTDELDTFTRTAVGLKSEHLDKARSEQRAAIEEFQEKEFPVRDFPDVVAASTFAQTIISRVQSSQNSGQYKVYWLNTCVLGYDAIQCASAAIQHLSGLLASDPKTSCILIAMPSVGSFGSQYEESSVEESAMKIKQRLSNPDLRLVVREIFLHFDPTSVPAQSKRAGVHKFVMALSDQGEKGQLVSAFAKSILWRRQVVPNMIHNRVVAVPMLPLKLMVDPRRDFTTAGHNHALAKAAIRRQWVSGWQVAAAFHDSLWQQVGLDNKSFAVWVDVFAYDHSMAECIMRRAKDAAVPSQMYIGTVWADMASRDDEGKSDKTAECAKVARWLQAQVKRKLYAHASEGILVVPNWKNLPDFRDSRSAPKINDADFSILHPAAAKNLPIRAEFAEVMETRVQSPDAKAAWTKLVEEHNATWNPSGKVWDSKRKAANATGEAVSHKKPRLLDPQPDQPTTKEELEAKSGKCIVFPFLQGVQLLAPTQAGGLWALAETDVTIDDLSQPLALIFGQFQVGEAISFTFINGIVFIIFSDVSCSISISTTP